MTKVSVSSESNMDDIVDKTYLYDQTVRILGNSWLFSCCDFFEHRYSDLKSTLVNIYTKMPLKLKNHDIGPCALGYGTSLRLQLIKSNLLATVPTLLIFSSSRSSPNNVALSFTSSGFLSLSWTSISRGGPFKYCRNSDCSNVPAKKEKH